MTVSTFQTKKKEKRECGCACAKTKIYEYSKTLRFRRRNVQQKNANRSATTCDNSIETISRQQAPVAESARRLIACGKNSPLVNEKPTDCKQETERLWTKNRPIFSKREPTALWNKNRSLVNKNRSRLYKETGKTYQCRRERRAPDGPDSTVDRHAGGGACHRWRRQTKHGIFPVSLIFYVPVSFPQPERGSKQRKDSKQAIRAP